MFGNGVATGMAVHITQVHRQVTRKVRHAARTACCAAVDGSTAPGAAECRPEVIMTPTAGTASSGSASYFMSENCEISYIFQQINREIPYIFR